MSKKKYIDADLLEECLNVFINMKPCYIDDYDCGYDDCFTAVQDIISDIPTADVAEVVRGKWIKKEHWVPLAWDCQPSYTEDYDDCYDEETHSWKEEYWHCSCCNYEASRGIEPVYKYCPNCGAKMTEVQK